MSEQLRQYCTLKGGTGFPEKYQGSSEGGIPFIKVSDMNLPGNERFISEANHYVSEVTAKLLNASIFNAGTTVFAKVGAALLLNRRRTLLRPTIIDNNMMAATPSDIDGDFLYHFLCSVDFGALVQSGALPSVNQNQIGGILVPNFTKTVQRKISTILSTIDTAIEQTEALVEKYQHIKAGLMHDLFTRGVHPNGQLRPPREQAPELYQQTAIGWIPREWQFGPIGTYFEIQLGKMLNQLAKTGRNSFPYLGNRSVQWNRLELDSLDLMDFSPDEQKKFALKNGDLLVCEGGEVGRTAIWESQMENCFYQKAIHRLRAMDSRMKPRFMLWYMHFAQSNGQFADFTSQSSIAHLTQEKLAKVPVLVPRTQEQELIISRIDAHEAVIVGQRKYLANLRAQKLGLMQDLLTGKVAVQIDAPAPEAVA